MDWKTHKIECKFLKEQQNDVHVLYPEIVRLILKLVVKLDNGGDSIKSYYAENYYRKFEDLMSRKFCLHFI